MTHYARKRLGLESKAEYDLTEIRYEEDAEESDENGANGTPTLEDLETLFVELAEDMETRPVLTAEATSRTAIYADGD